jgi:hypothetical protein
VGCFAPWCGPAGPRSEGLQKRLDGLEFRGRARLHITARAGDGHRKQLLLNYPWESDQLVTIRDGTFTVYEAFQSGVTLEQAIAEQGAAKAEADARCQAQTLASQTSTLQPSTPPPPTLSRSIPIDWPA